MRPVDHKKTRPFVLGIGGGLASGKSTVARLLARRGARTVDADRIGHQILTRPRVKQSLVEAFGKHILDNSGRISRPRLAEEVFGNPDKLERLDRIVHPPLLDEIRAQVDRLKREDDVLMVVIDAALLIEWQLHRELCDAVVFVDAPVDVRRRRAVSGRQMRPEQFDKRAQAQLPEETQRQQADYLLDNTASLAKLEKEVEKLWNAILTESSPRTT